MRSSGPTGLRFRGWRGNDALLNCLFNLRTAVAIAGASDELVTRGEVVDSSFVQGHPKDDGIVKAVWDRAKPRIVRVGCMMGNSARRFVKAGDERRDCMGNENV